jgi:hypothetical protein
MLYMLLRYCLVAVEWLAFHFLIKDVRSSNLDLETSYPNFFRSFPQSLQANSEIVPRIRSRLRSCTFFAIRIINRPVIQQCIIRGTCSVVK